MVLPQNLTYAATAIILKIKTSRKNDNPPHGEFY